ncbi:MAG: hypothetical protein COT43_04800 [Candidatus Marinimicrobia bacterium CG08_land_8_20_14_0_20_45_22]|nr:MAG: hypothetical protein COT43_04800 [Candidatus Marinimicrobia bacterium CG08_land_8_20_14_0_20_45_22]
MLMMDFPERLRDNKPLILDGAMGTELARRGFPVRLPLWSAQSVLEHPDAVRKIHEDYIVSGADILTTCTFRTDTRTFQKAGLSSADAKRATFQAVDLVKQSIQDSQLVRKVWIAGSMSPLEDCYHPELVPDPATALREHNEKASWLHESGVDFILIETMNTRSEAITATKAALSTQLPVIVSFILNNDGQIWNGDALTQTASEIIKLGATGISINCTHHRIITRAIEDLNQNGIKPVCAYANAGIYNPHSGWETDPIFTSEFYAETVFSWLQKGVHIVGGCCGINPKTISAIVKKVQRDGESLWTGG